MKRVFHIGVVGIILASLLTLTSLMSVRAQTAVEPPLTINRFKVISGDQYVEIKNNTNAEIAMDKVQLAYYNDYDLSKATTSKLISLSGTIPAGGFYLINDSTQALCYPTTVATASLGFATSSGRVQLVQLKQTNGSSSPFEVELLDYAAWYRGSATPPAGVVKFPATSDTTKFALRSWTDDGGNAVTPSVGSGRWQQAFFNGTDPCVPHIAVDTPAVEYEMYSFLSGELPPVRYAQVSSSGNKPVNRNVGKAAPIINELLPNPASPQTDADDEFIELYNPNDTVFDLTGFKLAFGSTNPKKYTFPEGSALQPKEFKAFTSGDTSISLSNTEAQVWLLDPNEQVIGTIDPYKSAKDGQAWALDSGKWLWTLQPTPNAMNTVALPTASASKEKTAAATLGISTGTTSSGTPSGDSSGAAGQLDDATPLHPGVLALVGLGALAYMLYEYRHDLSNKHFQFRRYLQRRQALRSKT